MSEHNTGSEPRETWVDPFAAAARGQGADARKPASEAGEMLRQMRQSAGVDPILLASTLKVTPQKIQALEEGRLDDLPDLIFARSLAAAVCRALGTDPDPVLARMPTITLGLPGAGEQREPPLAPATFHAGGSGGMRRWFADVPGWLTAVVAVLLIGALVVWFLPGRRERVAVPQEGVGSVASDAQQAASADDAASDAAGDVPDAPSDVPPDAASAPAEPQSSGSGPAAAASATAVPTASGNTASGLSAAASAAPQAGASAAAGQNGGSVGEQDVISFSATDPVWVGVRDGNGKTILGRTLNKGETLSIGGTLPLSVTVGNKGSIGVTVRGQPFDLNKNGKHKGTVVRFTVDSVPQAND